MIAVESLLIRMSCFFCVVLSLLTIYCLTDIWRIERRVGKPLEAVAIALLGSAVLLVGVIFGKCALTGCYPHAPEDRMRCGGATDRPRLFTADIKPIPQPDPDPCGETNGEKESRF